MPRALRHALLPALHWWRFLTQSPYFFAGPKGSSHSRYPGSIAAALHPNASQPFKAAPSSGADDDHASWDGGTNPACRRHTLLRPLSVPRRRPQLSKACPEGSKEEEKIIASFAVNSLGTEGWIRQGLDTTTTGKGA